jgi:hypothetical protein
MRALSGRTAILVVMMLASAGCRSGGSGWSWNRKKSSDELAAKADPTLPSAGATPVDYASPEFSSAAAAQGTASAFAAPAGASPEASPYANQAGYTPPASPYGAATQTPAGAAGAGPTAMQQQGSYADAYGAAAPPAAAPATAYPATAAPSAYQPGSTAATGADPHSAQDPYGTSPSQASPAADHYGAAAASSAPSPYDAPPAQPPVADPAAAYTADARYGSPAAAPTAQPEQAAAGGYGAAPTSPASADPYGAPSASPAVAEAPAAGGYQPGSTNYAPGQTGYSPPGVAPYTVPAEPNVVAQRKDPYYRPGGTSDYATGGKTPTAVADRYSNSTSAYSQPNPYMPADGSQSPSKGYTQ